MKTVKILSLSTVFVAALSSCGSDAVEATDKKEVSTDTVATIAYGVDTAASVLNWHGEKLAYGHDGTIEITSGELSMKGDTLKAGNFVVDMKTIVETGEGKPEDKAKLAGHLMAADFFDAEKYPVSKFEITAAVKKDGKYEVSGNLMIKDSTKNITFPADIKVEGDKVTATAEFTIDRTQWNVVYGSGISGAVGDNIISNDIKFKVNLVANKK
jgi:polyisoprenoid-binding protein YceI